MSTYKTTLLGFQCEVEYTYVPEESPTFDPPNPGWPECIDINKVHIKIEDKWVEVPDYDDFCHNLEGHVLKQHKDSE